VSPAQLHAMQSRYVRYCTNSAIDFVPLACTLRVAAGSPTTSEGGRCLLSRPLCPFCVFWGRWQLLIYLFRDERTDNRALTMDVTGRNIPPVTSATVWLFVEAINTHKLPPWWDTEYLRYAVRQVRMIGFYLFEAGRVRPPPTQTC
jgi:hypothetical protein